MSSEEDPQTIVPPATEEEWPKVNDVLNDTGNITIADSEARFHGYVWQADRDHKFGCQDIKRFAIVVPYQYTANGWRIIKAVDHNRTLTELTLVTKALGCISEADEEPQRFGMTDVEVHFFGNYSATAEIPTGIVPCGTPWRKRMPIDDVTEQQRAALADRQKFFENVLGNEGNIPTQNGHLHNIPDTPNGRNVQMSSPTPGKGLVQVSDDEIRRRLGGAIGHLNTSTHCGPRANEHCLNSAGEIIATLQDDGTYLEKSTGKHFVIAANGAHTYVETSTAQQASAAAAVGDHQKKPFRRGERQDPAWKTQGWKGEDGAQKFDISSESSPQMISSTVSHVISDGSWEHVHDLDSLAKQENVSIDQIWSHIASRLELVKKYGHFARDIDRAQFESLPEGTQQDINKICDMINAQARAPEDAAGARGGYVGTEECNDGRKYDNWRKWDDNYGKGGYDYYGGGKGKNYGKGYQQYRDHYYAGPQGNNGYYGKGGYDYYDDPYVPGYVGKGGYYNHHHGYPQSASAPASPRRSFARPAQMPPRVPGTHHPSSAALHDRAFASQTDAPKPPQSAPPPAEDWPGVGTPLPGEDLRDPSVLLRLQGEVVSKAVAKGLQTIASASQQTSAGKAVAPKCTLSNYTKTVGLLTTHLDAYELEVWRYVISATGLPQLGLALQEHCTALFERLLAVELPNWVHESPFWTPPEELNKVTPAVIGAICNNIKDRGDPECVVDASKWIQQYGKANLTKETLLLENSWVDVIAYIVKINFKYNHAALYQTKLEEAVQKPALTKSGIYDQLAQWDQDLLALVTRDPSAAATYCPVGAKFIHKRLLEMFKHDMEKGSYIVKYATDYCLNNRSTTYHNYRTFVEQVKILVAPKVHEQGSQQHGGGGGGGINTGSRFRCMLHVMGECTKTGECPRGFSHAKEAEWPHNSRMMLSKIAKQKNKSIPHFAIQECNRVEGIFAKLCDFDDNFDQNDFTVMSTVVGDDDAFRDAADRVVGPEGTLCCLVCDVTNNDEGDAPLDGCDNSADPVINSNIVLDNGFIVACYTAVAPAPAENCAWWLGCGFCPHEIAHGPNTCRFKHPMEERARFVNVRCDPKRCKKRASCPKNHTDKDRVKRLIDVSDNGISVNKMLLESRIAAHWDYSAILDAQPVRDFEVKLVVTGAFQSGAILSDGGANGAVMDARDIRVCYISDITTNLIASDGRTCQRMGVFVLPFYERAEDENTHSRSKPPPTQKWARVAGVVLNIEASPDKPFAHAIVPANWFNHFTHVDEHHAFMRRHDRDALQPSPDDVKFGAGLTPVSIAWFWDKHLPWLAGSDVISFRRADVATPLPWEAGWQGPPSFAHTVNQVEHDRFLADLFPAGP